MTQQQVQVKSNFKANSLYWLANKYRKVTTDEDIIEKQNITQLFYDELEYMVEHGEIITININAKMRLGKSTCMLSLAYYIFELLKKHGIRKKTEQFGMENIAFDQSDYTEKMRNPQTAFTVIGVDEQNQTEETGQDTTIIKAQEEDFSNIHADRYVHRVSCSPHDISDKNADILLYIDAKDEEIQETHAKLYYRYWEGQIEYTQILGYVTIKVGHIIKNWISTVRPQFYEKLRLEGELAKELKEHKNKTKKAEEIETKIKKLTKTIVEWQQRDWYVNYYMKKRKRLELITKYKISKPRILKYAPAILTVIERFRPIARYPALIKREIIKNNVKIEMRKKSLPQSIVGEELTTQEVMGVLESIKCYHIIKAEISHITEQIQKGRQPKGDIETLQKVATETAENIELQVKEYERCQELLDEYNKGE